MLNAFGTPLQRNNFEVTAAAEQDVRTFATRTAAEAANAAETPRLPESD